MDEMIDKSEYEAAVKSFFNVFALFAEENEQEQHAAYLDCIHQWGLQLFISEEKLNRLRSGEPGYKFRVPDSQQDAIEQVYDIVYMIYLDKVVEDIELEIVMKFAEKLGFEKHVVGDLVKAIVTAPYDGISRKNVRKELAMLLDDARQ